MKRILLSVIFVLMFLGACLAQQMPKGYKIIGHISETPNGTKFFLVKSTQGRADTVSTAIAQNGQFHIEGTIPEQGEFYFLKLDTTYIKLQRGEKSYITLLLTNSEITVSGKLQQWPFVSIEGSQPTVDYENFLEKDRLKRIELNRLSRSDTLTNKQQIYASFLIEHALLNNTSYASAYFIFNSSDILTLKQLDSTYSRFNDSVRSSHYGLRIKAKINALLNKTDFKIGGSIPDFYILSYDNRRLSVLQLCQSSKVTLIDFWAWWCGPCRSDVPNLKKVYADYRGKGFNIISISTDTDRKNWIKALKEDQCPWQQGIDVDNASKLLFNIHSIPAYILVNNQGTVIAIDGGFGRGGEIPREKHKIVDPQEKVITTEVGSTGVLGLRRNLDTVISNLLK